MEKKYYDERPAPFETIRSAGMMATIIRMEVKESEDPEQGAWECEEVEYNHKESLTEEKDYGPMVSTLIRAHYSRDQVEAITQNYLSDPEEHKQEFDDLQAWREECKRIAKNVIP
jgi:hypothetical protein